MKVVAVCSCPRLGFMDFMANSIVAFSQNGVGLHNSYGAYWDQALCEAMRKLDGHADLIMTCDYDSLFTADNVGYLIHLMEENPDVGAICSMQQGRGVQHLFTTDTGTVSREELEEELVPIASGNFGLTIIRADVLEKMEKPWMIPTPDSEGDFKPDSDKVDSDTSFWYKMKEAGVQPYLAPRNVIGHLELMVKWPSKNLQPAFQSVKDYREKGIPNNIWH